MISLWVFPLPVRGDVSSVPDRYGPVPKKNYAPAKYTYSEGSDLHLTHFQGELIKRKPGDTRPGMLVDMKAGYGHLFSPSSYGYRGFGYFTAKLDSDHKLRFNSSLGHFLPVIGGEFFFTHRLLRRNLVVPVRGVGSVEDKVYENSFSANYSRFNNGFLRETSLSYSLSTIPGHEFGGLTTALDSEDVWHTTRSLSGYSDTTTHAMAAQIAFGTEKMAFDLISGFKTSLGVGYEYVEHAPFHDHPGQVIESFSASASLEQQTAIGLLKTSYKHLKSARKFYAGYSFRGVELYFKNTEYKESVNTQLFGFKIKVDLNTLGLPLRKKIKSLFRKETFSYSGNGKIRHSARINSDSFIAQPKIQESICGW